MPCCRIPPALPVPPQAEDKADALALRAWENEYRQARRNFILAACLTIPVMALAMTGHLIPALEPILQFPGKPWVEMLLSAPVLFWAGRQFFCIRLAKDLWTQVQRSSV